MSWTRSTTQSRVEASAVQSLGLVSRLGKGKVAKGTGKGKTAADDKNKMKEPEASLISLAAAIHRALL